MGMYTGLRADVCIKPEYRPAIAYLHDGDHWWRDVRANFPNLPGIDGWCTVGSCQFIPFGALFYMPDGWGDASDDQGYSTFDVDTGRWRFCCSLKNYESEIEQFLTTVLSKIVESVNMCETLYEEDDAPTAHLLIA